MRDIRLTSPRFDVHLMAALGGTCLGLVFLVPANLWTLPCVSAGIINLVNAKRLRQRLDKMALEGI
jgi:hypothetical protein